MPRSLLSRLAATLLLAACAAPDRVTAPPVPPIAIAPAPDPAATDGSASIAATRLALEAASHGLLYTSESDYPFTYVFRAGPVATPVTEAAFRAAFGVPAATPVEVITLDAFFARHIERVDPADPVGMALVPRYVALRETLRHVLRQTRVFRVGRIAIGCYVVGTDWAGHIVGLSTVSIET